MSVFRRKKQPPAEHREPAAQAGTPGRCPRCDGYGYIDQIDLRARFQSQHCRACGHRWEFDFDDDGVLIDHRADTGFPAAAPESVRP